MFEILNQERLGRKGHNFKVFSFRSGKMTAKGVVVLREKMKARKRESVVFVKK